MTVTSFPFTKSKIRKDIERNQDRKRDLNNRRGIGKRQVHHLQV